MQRPNGHSAHLIIGCEGPSVWIAWFLNDKPIGIRNFADVGSAIHYSERMQFQNWSIGWRLATDRDDAPPSPVVE